MARRKIHPCLNCQEVREIAAHSLCFRCYRAQERAAENDVDRHSPAIQKSTAKLIRAYAALLGNLGVLGVGRQDLDAIRRILAPYVEPIAGFLKPPEDDGRDCERIEEIVH